MASDWARLSGAHTGFPYFHLTFTAEIPCIPLMEDGFDLEKDAANQRKHDLSLVFGDSLFKDDNHL